MKTKSKRQSQKSRARSFTPGSDAEKQHVYDVCRRALFDGGYDPDGSGWHPAGRMALLAEDPECPISLKYLIWKDLLGYVAVPKALEMRIKQADVIGAVGVKVISYSGELLGDDGSAHFGLPDEPRMPLPAIPWREDREPVEPWERVARHQERVNEQIRREAYSRPAEPEESRSWNSMDWNRHYRNLEANQRQATCITERPEPAPDDDDAWKKWKQ